MKVEKLLDIARANSTIYYNNRIHASKFLINHLINSHATYDVLVIIPQGGLEIALEIVKKIPFKEILVCPVKKIGSPVHDSFGLGAIDIFENAIINEDARFIFNVTETTLNSLITKSIASQKALYKDLKIDIGVYKTLFNKRLLIVDDAISTGYTMKAAIDSLKHFQPHLINCIVPISNRPGFEYISEQNVRVYSEIIESLPVFYADYFYDRFDNIDMAKSKALVDEIKVANEK